MWQAILAVIGSQKIFGLFHNKKDCNKDQKTKQCKPRAKKKKRN
jgi:hypothetical protein